MGKRLQDQKGEKMSEASDRCDLCGGEMRLGTTTLEIWRGQELLVISDVPADVCQQCHEAYISAEVSAQLDRFLAEPRRPEKYLTVPQYSARQAVGG